MPALANIHKKFKANGQKNRYKHLKLNTNAHTKAKNFFYNGNDL